jgi:uncharacterized protein YdeI (YjbR/CyaY-like superfamily)
MIHFSSPQELENWLETNHLDETELWIEIYKKHTGVPSLEWADLVEVVLCFGWIDSQRKRIDEDRYCQRITPRRSKSLWSKRNCAIIEKLEKEGRLRPAGLKQVEAARVDGRWDNAY